MKIPFFGRVLFLESLEQRTGHAKRAAKRLVNNT